MLRLFVFMGTYTQEVLADSPIRYYKLDDTNGIDTMGGSNLTKGTTSAAPTTGAAGQSNIGAAWSFDGNDWASFPMPTITTQASFEMFFKCDASSAKSSHTFMRFDGASVGVIRMQGDGVVYPGEIYGVFGSAGEFHTGTRYDDGNWHHLVVTLNGTAIKVYVDGVLKNDLTTGSSTYTFASTGYLGRDMALTTAELLIGQLDEVAVYNTVLSPTRIAAHSNNRGSGGYAAEVATGSGALVQATAIVGKFATTFNDESYHGVVKTSTGGVSLVSLPGSGLLVTGNDGTSTGTLTFPLHTLEVGGEMVFRFSTGNVDLTITTGGVAAPTFTLDTAPPYDTYYVRVKKLSNTQVQYKRWVVGAAESAFTTSTVTSTPTANVSIAYDFDTGGGTFSLQYLSVNTKGVASFPDAVIAASVATGSGLAGNATVDTTVPVNYSATPATGSGLMVSPVVDNATNVSVGATAATGSGLAVDPSVTTVRAPTIYAEPFLGSGVLMGGGFAVPVTVAVEKALGSGLIVDATITAEKNAVINAQVATGSGVEPQALLEIDGVVYNPALFNNPYYQEVFATTDDDDFWYRLDEQSGTVIHDARGNAAKDADLVGSYAFGYYGPESRKAIKFNDGYFKRRWATESSTVQGLSPIDDSETDQFAFEVVLRTTDGNGMLAYGLDRTNPMIETGPVPYFRNSIYLKDGKVTTNWNTLQGSAEGSFELSGVTNVADGQWHHIVVAFNYGPINNLDSGLRIYIDGKLDIRRRRDVVPGVWASPDSYFGIPEAWRAVTPLYPWQKNFNGEVMEVVFRYNDWLTHDNTIELFYDVFGIVPIRVTPAVGYGEMPDALGKGNQKRILVLYTKWSAQGLFSRIGDERHAPSRLSTTVPDEFDHAIDLGRVLEPGENPWIDLAGFRVSAAPIMREDYEVLAGPYRDPITDLPRLIDLQEDLDLDEYDVIMFRNWPDEGADREVFYQRGYSNDAINDFLASVKQAVVDGNSLELTNISLAFELGLVSGAQPIPMTYDRDGSGEYDLHGSIIYPWDAGDGGGKPFLDLHANQWHRIVADVENLTNIEGSENITEAVMTYNYGEDGDVPNKWAYKIDPEPLTIGDEILSPAVFYNRILAWGDDLYNAWTWDKHVWAVTPNGLRVGTPIYKFNAQTWAGNTLVDNPYAEYIGGAIVQPGDTWDGVRVAGKVFMNFAENPIVSGLDAYSTAYRQLVPPNSELVNPNDHETDAMREWDYSFTRVAYAAQIVGEMASSAWDYIKANVKEDGSVNYVKKKTSAQAGIIGINIVEKYPTEPIIVLSWTLRGLAWLASGSSIAEGDVVVRPTAAVATAVLADPQTVAERSVTVSATPALALGVLVAPAEAEDPDVNVIAFPAEGSGVMTGYGKTITVAPFLGSGEMVDNFDLISASGEQVVLYLHALKEVELYLMEGIK